MAKVNKAKQTFLKIYNPNDKPFGPLSNNKVYPMKIDGEMWNTVTNYILTNLLTTPLYRAALRDCSDKSNKIP